MHNITVNASKFAFKELPAYAAWLLKEKLDDFVVFLLKMSREEQLPLLAKLDKLTEEQLMDVGRQSYTTQFEALSENAIHEHIKENVSRWVANNLEVIDRNEVVAEDISLLAFIKRRSLCHFTHQYTTDVHLQRYLACEIDTYTTQEELVSYNTYIKMQQEQLNKAYNKLTFQESLLLEAQEISELGSFFIDMENPEESTSTPQTHKITGISFGDQESFFKYIHPDDVDDVNRQWEYALQNGGKFNYSFRYLRDNTEKKLNSRGVVMMKDGKPHLVKGTLRDITVTDTLIRKLTDSEALHNQAQQLTHLGNWSWTIGDDTVQWSDEMYRIYGLEPQSEKITFESFMAKVHPDDRTLRQQQIHEALETGNVAEYTVRIIAAGGEIKVLKGRGGVEYDAKHKPVRLVGTCQDITNEYHLNRELVSLNASLSQKNSELLNTNKELESFNYIASHDLQEPLRKIQMFAGRLMDQASTLQEPAILSLKKVIESAARMQRLIGDLIEFSQISSRSEAQEVVSISDFVDEAMEAFSEAIDNGEAEFDVNTPHAMKVVPFQFLQLLSNIFSNAIKYRKDNVPVKIDVRSKIVDSTDPAVDIGNWLKISICDNGIGFDSDQKDNIFDLFKRLHANGKYSGTGIGLAICKKIVNNHNGFINADSIIGKGSCFHIYLPTEE
ncbi:MAG TPA: PAS domain-containing protein [Flavobacterium sp.]|nr:PAS domain-containing protein [Flavobacterium sp.]